MGEIHWERYPLIEQNPLAKSWLVCQCNLTQNTVDAYGRGLEDYLSFCNREFINPLTATREHVSRWVNDLKERPNPRGPNVVVLDSGASLSNSTLQQRLTAARLFYDHLIEDGVKPNNPVGRGRYTPGKSFSRKKDRGLVPRVVKLPWIPTDEEWQKIIVVLREETLRTKTMFMLGYDCATRRGELCRLEIHDFDFANRLLTIRGEITKNGRGRVVPFSEGTNLLLVAYLRERRRISLESGHIFLSESHRNRGDPLSIWGWSKIIRGIALRSEVNRLKTHSTRHLCLTDLARAGWDINDIANPVCRFQIVTSSAKRSGSNSCC